MSTHDDGGPAFPRPAFTPGLAEHDNAAGAGFANTGSQGMSLRDWFAGKALAALIQCDRGEVWDWDLIANRAHKMADAMLAARKAGL